MKPEISIETVQTSDNSVSTECNMILSQRTEHRESKFQLILQRRRHNLFIELLKGVCNMHARCIERCDKDLARTMIQNALDQEINITVTSTFKGSCYKGNKIE